MCVCGVSGRPQRAGAVPPALLVHPLLLPSLLACALPVLFCAVQALKHCHTLQHHIRFTKYDQSHRCLTLRDSSVSYASAIVTIER